MSRMPDLISCNVSIYVLLRMVIRAAGGANKLRKNPATSGAGQFPRWKRFKIKCDPSNC